MLTRLGLQNFKSWKSIDSMRLAPITGLFGANSSGKTSILQLLLMLKQTADSPDRAQVLNLGDERSLVSLGTYRDVQFRHRPEAVLDWQLAWTLPRPLAVYDPDEPRRPLFTTSSIFFRAEVTGLRGGRLSVREFHYTVDGRDFRMQRVGESGLKYQLATEGFHLRRSRGRPTDLPPPIKCYGFPDQARAYFQNVEFLADLELAFEEFFDRIYYLGPLREYPQRQYTWAGAQPIDVGRRGERVVDALLAARDRDMSISPGPRRRRIPFEQYIAQWLARLGLIQTFSVERITDAGNLYEVRARKDAKSAQVLITDVGFGVSQVLPVLVLCYYVPEGSTIMLEQPEIHLHPRVQAGLADVFIDAVKTRRVQILLESHSEHLLRRLQLGIAQEKLAANDAAVYFCHLDGGDSRLQTLTLDSYGNITNWPEGFFGDEFGELAAMTEAAMERKKREAA